MPMRTSIGAGDQASRCRARCASTAAFDRLRRRGKGRRESIADDLKDGTAMVLDRLAQQGVMPRQESRHGSGNSWAILVLPAMSVNRKVTVPVGRVLIRGRSEPETYFFSSPAAALV